MDIKLLIGIGILAIFMMQNKGAPAQAPARVMREVSLSSSVPVSGGDDLINPRGGATLQYVNTYVPPADISVPMPQTMPVYAAPRSISVSGDANTWLSGRIGHGWSIGTWRMNTRQDFMSYIETQTGATEIISLPEANYRRKIGQSIAGAWVVGE